MLFMLTCMGAWAQTVINIGSGQGKYYNPAGSTVSGGFNAIKFVSNATPTVTLEADADHPEALHSSDGRIGINDGVTTFTISVPEGYRIKEYQFEAKAVNNNHPARTFTPESEEARDIPRDQTWRTYKVENVNAQSTSFTLASSAWSPINSRNFKVTVEEDGVTEEQVAAFEKMGDWLALIQNQALVTDPSFYTSNALQTNDGQGYAGLLDKDTQTFFHSQYSGTNPGTYHHLQANLSESVNGFYLYTYKRVQNNNNRPNEIVVMGSSDGILFNDITTLSGSQLTAQDDFLSEKISTETPYQYLRFEVLATNTNAKFGNFPFFTYSEFWLLPSNETTDAAFELMKTVTSAGSLTPEQIAQINQIDEELRNSTVNVTYNLVENGTAVNSIEVTQAKNSAASIPTNLTNGYSSLGYNFVSEGTIGSSDCTITVTATPKAGVVTDLANLSNNKAYALATERGELGTNGTQMVSTFGTSFAPSNFAIISYEGKYFLWSVADSKWVSNQNQPALTENVGEAAELVFDPTGLNKPLFFFGMGSNGVNVSNYDSGIVVNSWTTRDGGNQYIITETDAFNPEAALEALDAYFHPSYMVTYVVKDQNGAELFRSEPVGTTEGANITTLPEAYQRSLFYTYNTVDVTISAAETEVEFTATTKENAPFQPSTMDAPVWYNLLLHPNDKHYPTYVADGTPNVTLPTANADDETTQWAFIGTPYNGFQIVNKAAGTSLVLGSAAAGNSDNNGGNTYATLGAAGSQTYETWTVSASTHATNGFFIANGQNYKLNYRSTANLAYWTSGFGAGSTFVATKVLTDEEKYNELIAQLESYDLGDNLHQYNFEGKTTDEANAAISTLKDEGYTPENLAEAQALLAAVKLNLPKANTFLRIKAVDQNGYVSSKTGEEVQEDLAGGAYATLFTTTGTADEIQTIWLYDGEHLINYATRLFTTGCTADAPGVENPVTFTFQEATDVVSKYWVKPANANYWYGGNPTLDFWSAPVGRSQTRFELEEVTELPFTIGAAGQATVQLPVAFTVPSGVTVRYAVREHDGLLTLEDATVTAVPANEPVVLVGNPGTYTLVLTTTEETIEGNLLSGTGVGGVDIDASTKAYVLAKPAGEVVFALLNSETDRYIAAFKAYYVSTAAGDAPAYLFFDENDVTGINAVNAAVANGAAVYDLQGRRVNNATKGVYIINGQKVLVK